MPQISYCSVKPSCTEDLGVVPAARRNEYLAYEAEVFEALAALVRDAASLRVYLAAAMIVEAETFTRATVTGKVLSSSLSMSQNGLQPGQNNLSTSQNELPYHDGLTIGQNGMTDGQNGMARGQNGIAYGESRLTQSHANSAHGLSGSAHGQDEYLPESALA